MLVMVLCWLAGLLPAFDTVVIDAGHGGKDPGSVWKPHYEKTLCLDVAKRLNTALKARGFKTVMTRTDDTYVELSERAVIANKHPGAIFVSIHFNANRDRTVRGFETHYRSDKGKVLAAEKKYSSILEGAMKGGSTTLDALRSSEALEKRLLSGWKKGSVINHAKVGAEMPDDLARNVAKAFEDARRTREPVKHGRFLD